MGELQVSFYDGYHESLLKLESAEAQRVTQALVQFMKDMNHPSLNVHPVKDAQRGLMSLRASDELRVIALRRGNTWVWLYADHHDAAYERAGRMRTVIDIDQGIQIIPLDRQLTSVGASTSGSNASAGDHLERAEAPARRPFDHWALAELQQAGFSDEQIARIRALTSSNDVVGLLDADWSEGLVDQLIEMMELTPEKYFAAAESPDDEALADEAERRLRSSIARFGALAGLSRLFNEDELERLAAAPIEEWMLFLHPDQRSLVDREFNGPARVRGAAGTGKTVVVLHRAAALAERYSGSGSEAQVGSDPNAVAEFEDDGRILVTTYIKSLPPVLEELYRRLPNADPETVDFIHVASLAHRICTEAGQSPTVNIRAVDTAFKSAWKSVVTSGSPIDRAGLTRDYMRDEVTGVIKGRGISDLDTYLDVRRTGRRTKFGDPLRAQAWELKLAWDEAMQSRGVEDFADVVLRARDVARGRSTPTYRAVLIDEAQDLSLVALQMLRSLVNGPGPDRPDALFISGDGAQRIYAGGFTLRQAGVEVRGRTALLRKNYRNTAQIFRAAMSVAGDADVEDLGEDYVRSEEPAELDRIGAPVELISAVDFADEMAQIIERLEELVATSDSLGPGDIAVFCATNHLVADATRHLREAGHAVQNLKDYDGVPSNRIKVGTHHRAKGLEFKAVFLPGLTDGEFPGKSPEGTDVNEAADAEALRMSALFVAMTRARDHLVLSCSQNPSAALEPVLADLELVEA